MLCLSMALTAVPRCGTHHSEDPETVSTVRRIAQRKLEEELEYVETDSVYSYRL